MLRNNSIENQVLFSLVPKPVRLSLGAIMAIAHLEGQIDSVIIDNSLSREDENDLGRALVTMVSDRCAGC